MIATTSRTSVGDAATTLGANVSEIAPGWL
jgi:hypothetical protein